MGLDILHAYNTSVDLGCHMLGLAEEEALLWSPGMVPQPFSQVVGTDQVISAQCKGVVMAQLESPP